MRIKIILLSAILLTYTALCFCQTPGGVSTSPLTLWFKGNQGVVASGSNVSQWNDASGNANVTTPATKTANSHCVIVNTGANFNPTIQFDGTRLEQLKGTANNLGGTPTIFTVSRCNNIETFNPIFSNFDINPLVADPNDAKEVGPGIFLYFQTYVVDANEAWIPFSADAPATAGKLDIMSSMYTQSTTTNNTFLFQNGVLADNHNSGGKIVTPGKPTFEIGGRSADDATYPGRIFNGDIAEVVYFRDQLAAADRQKVETYLAIKYGITLGQNYIGSNSASIYDVSNFQNRIIGIGRDDISGLLQKQSKGENYVPILQIGRDSLYSTNEMNPGSFTSDISYFVAGDNDLPMVANSSGVPPGVSTWLSRIWKATITGSGGSNLYFQMPLNLGTQLPGNGPLSLLMSDDPTFTTGLRVIKLSQNTEGYYAKVPTLSTGLKYFTFVRCLQPTAGPDVPTCDNTSTHDFGDAATFENWTLLEAPAGANASIGVSNGIANGLNVAGTYTFSLNNAVCECSDTVKVIRSTSPTITPIVTNSPICEGATLNLMASTSNNIYNWSGPNGFSSTIPNPTINLATLQSSGTYTISSNNGTCAASQNVNVVVNATPILNISPDTTICSSAPIQLAASGGMTYLWSPEGTLSNPNISNPIATPLGTITYRVISGNSNCKDTAFTTITFDQALCDSEIHFPTGFTPNNDGRNDLFRVANGYSIIAKYNLSVYNKWGQLIFQTDVPKVGWDGRLNGILQASDVFVWQSNYTLRNGNSYFKKGTFALIR